MNNYTPDQIEDITQREQQGLDALKALGLTPAAIMQKVNMGNDVFADKVLPYLQDTKYTNQSINVLYQTPSEPVAPITL